MKLYNCKCRYTSGKNITGMNVEILITSGNPKSDDIKNAVERKYGVSLRSSAITMSYWDCVLIS